MPTLEPQAASSDRLPRALDVRAGLVPVSAASGEDLQRRSKLETCGAGETVVAAGTLPAALGGVEVLHVPRDALDRLILSDRDVAVRLNALVQARTAEATQALETQEGTQQLTAPVSPVPARGRDGLRGVRTR